MIAEYERYWVGHTLRIFRGGDKWKKVPCKSISYGGWRRQRGESIPGYLNSRRASISEFNLNGFESICGNANVRDGRKVGEGELREARKQQRKLDPFGRHPLQAGNKVDRFYSSIFVYYNTLVPLSGHHAHINLSDVEHPRNIMSEV